MGSVNLDNTGSGSAITLSSDGTSLLLGGSAVGGDPDLYRDNPVSATTPTASGDNALAIGNTAVASGENSFAIGSDTDATGLNSLALGKGAQAVSTRCIAMGLNASAQADRSIAIGNNGNVANATYATAIGSGSVGSGSEAHGSGSVALSNARTGGVDSFAAIIANNTSSYGATGTSSIAMGYQSKSTGNYAVAIGSAQATGSDYGVSIGYNARSASHSTVAIGREAGLLGSGSSSISIGHEASSSGYESLAIGRNVVANSSNSVAIGRYARTGGIIGKYAFANGYINSSGDVQQGKYVLHVSTTDATAIALTSTGTTASATNQVNLQNNSAYAFSGTIVARQQAADGTACAAWKVEGLIRREANAGTTVLVNSATTVLDNTPSWGMALSADTTNGCLKIQATGAALTDIRWVATIHTSEVTYA